MKSRILLSALLATLFLVAPAQTGSGSEARQRKADSILKKARRIDLLSQIMPLLLTKAQMKELLPPIEAARREVTRIEQQEYNELLKIEGKLDSAYAEALKNERSPNRAALADAYATFKYIQIRRNAAAQENVTRMMEVLTKVLNEGQKKAMAGSLKPTLSGVDPSKMTETQRMRYFAGDILLDPETYPIISQLVAK